MPTPLQSVTAATTRMVRAELRHEEARLARDRAIQAASQAGHSLREIGRAASLSYSAVAKILRG